MSSSIKHTTISADSPISLGNRIRRINLVGFASITVIRCEVAIEIWQSVNIIRLCEKPETDPGSENVVGNFDSPAVA